MPMPQGERESIALIAAGDTLLVFGVYSDGHYWADFLAGKFADRRVTALSTADGKLRWSRPLGYRVRPLVIGDTLHAEPWMFDLATGMPKTRIHPITGQNDRWQFCRPGHHCGCPIGSRHLLIFRSWCLGYYDLDSDAGTMHFGGQRPGCWINAIPAGGLLLMPEASAGCMCNFPNMCSVALKPAGEDRGYAWFSAPARRRRCGGWESSSAPRATTKTPWAISGWAIPGPGARSSCRWRWTCPSSPAGNTYRATRDSHRPWAPSRRGCSPLRPWA